MGMEPTRLSAPQFLEAASQTNISVLLLGESGCGKEVAARHIHEQSSRKGAPFIAVNCGALPSSLQDSLLSGYRKGAFSGAQNDHQGLVESAQGGTLFLDEIGELPPESQTRFLRILQERKVHPLGSSQEIPVDFRLICATHRDLHDDVVSGKFRQDLFHRIASLTIRLPPLRERLSDLMPIAQSLWQQITGTNASLSSEDILQLRSYEWPGNIRQLGNVLQRLHVLARFGVTLSDLLTDERNNVAALTMRANEKTTSRAKSPPRPAMLAALEAHGFNKSRTAKALGISRGGLCYQLRKCQGITSICSTTCHRIATGVVQENSGLLPGSLAHPIQWDV